ncbi:UDP-N-acetylmuramoylalanine--D-glutamate ligase,UDP-N-acetylmuramoyl-L-alanyl-D-glutamate synthetase,UDP-N-acetylmuramoylalanine--D-glutamate ligase,Mur ligase middle domain [Chlamydia serpentis]|uniref:UDP-N-acetylmuramoylalanine--D-glutamate ligase n=1 Tax=Chlamydia serpentis TaxID=1967782 RepID=A0A2R8FCC6_9CHLA|nr:UDP-N-acetylmuramoyl-L-alanine--D-glutamate ligase [Chlamydia serpentis]SPN74011.1 UDP-N-acetylmuramoylalanine--D-glutamate ligase,UDP-N-acetylmuramoyl-L-alanyl-D-glutamate synthetase,UDP-N-acetylmuramoylalanine--D-glutamate ligase,Mur ligase middle domain [Chlamydia serpentis]
MYQRILVLGTGITGKSVSKFLYKQGHYVLGADNSLESLTSTEGLHERLFIETDDFPGDIDLVVRSPGIKPYHPWVEQALRFNIPVVTDIQVALKTPEFQQYPSLGITGSNGKTTTTLFLVHLLNTLGIPALAMGNIGLPILNQMIHPGIRVVEISSFQLATQDEDIPTLSGAVLLNFSPNHLDYHGNLDTYLDAKLRIKKCLKQARAFWLGMECSSGNLYQSYSEEIQNILDKGDALKPIYLHDRDNYCAAYALANEVSCIPSKDFLKAVQTFKKPAHRLEYLGEKHCVHYINDSKATTVNAVEKALMAIGKNIIVILGGRNKGGNFVDLTVLLSQTTKHVVAMGECREMIAHALSGTIPLTLAKDLKEAVYIAQTLARDGDTILLSPGCASFDQFQSFEERGAYFKLLIGEMEAVR